MTIAICYDTETTGLPLYSEPSERPDQPHIVQLAAALVDMDTFDVIESLNLIICPDGWIIPDEVIAIHGITNEIAAASGVPEAQAVSKLIRMSEAADFRLGHNQSFDERIVRIALHRYLDLFKHIATWKAMPSKCTAMLSKPLCKLPPTDAMLKSSFRSSFKTPNLAEAHRHFTGHDFENAHTAQADVTACIAVYRGILTATAAA